MEPDPPTATHINPVMESGGLAMPGDVFGNVDPSPDALVAEDSSGTSEASDNISQTSLESRDSKSSGSFSNQLPPEIGSNADAIGILREHAPLLNLLSLIPRKAQKGLMLTCDLLLTCIDVSPEHIALGTNIGLVFLYDRKKYQLERLKCHSTNDRVTCVQMHSAIETMVAAGLASGTICIFQLPSTLIMHKKQLQRTVVGDLHKCYVSCLEWNSNGMRLFSGDVGGNVGSTTVDFTQGQCRSELIKLEDTSEVIQLDFANKALAISTKHRSYVLRIDDIQSVVQIGKKDRKSLGPFGACFKSGMCKTSDVELFACRPGFRIWQSNIRGEVIATYMFKQLLSRPYVEIGLLKTERGSLEKDIQFGQLYRYEQDLLLTWSGTSLFIIDPIRNVVVGGQIKLGNVIDVAICGEEIFVLRMGAERNLIRIAKKSESILYTAPSHFPESSATTHGLSNHSSSSMTVQGDDRANRSSSPLSFLQTNIFSKIKPLGMVGRDKQTPQYTVPENYDRIVSESNQSYDMSAIEAEELPPVVALPSEDVQKIQVFSVNGPVELDVLINKDSVDTKLTGSETFPQPRSDSRSNSPSCSSETIDNAHSHIFPESPVRTVDVKLPSPPCVQSPDMPSHDNCISSSVQSGTIVAVVPEIKSLNSVAESSKILDSSKNHHPGPPNFRLSKPVDGTDDIIFATKPKKPKKKKHKLEKKDALISVPSSEESKLIEEMQDSISVSSDSGSPFNGKQQNSPLLDSLSAETTQVESNLLQETETWKGLEPGSAIPENNPRTGDIEPWENKIIDAEKQCDVLQTILAEVDSFCDKEEVISSNSLPESEQNDILNSQSTQSKHEGRSPLQKSNTIYKSFDTSTEDFYGKYRSLSISDGSLVSCSDHPLTSPDFCEQEDSSLTPEVEQAIPPSPVTSIPPDIPQQPISKLVNSWTDIVLPANVKSLSLSKTHVWYVDETDSIFYSVPTGPHLGWRKLSISARHISVSVSGHIVWRLHRNTAFVAVKAGPWKPDGIRWVEGAKDVEYVSASDTCVWYIKNDGKVYIQKDLSKDRPLFRSYLIPCQYRLTQIACNGKVVWGVTDKCELVYRAGITEKHLEGSGWEIAEKTCKEHMFNCVALGDCEMGWAVDLLGRVWFCSGITMAMPLGDHKWWEIPISSYYMQDTTAMDSFLSLVSRFDPQQLAQLVNARKGGLIVAGVGGTWFCPQYKNMLQVCRGSMQGHRWAKYAPKGMASSVAWKRLCPETLYQEHGLMWAQQANGDMFVWDDDGEHCSNIPRPGSKSRFTNMSVCQSAVWGLTSDGDVFVRNGIGPQYPQGSQWDRIDLTQLGDVHFIHVSCGTENVWALDSDSIVYLRIGVKAPSAQMLNPAWLPVDSGPEHCQLTHVYVGSKDWMVWAIDNHRHVYVRTGVTETMQIGTGWTKVPGTQALELSIGGNFVYALNTDGELMCRYGISMDNYSGDYWKKIPGDFFHISASSDDHLWAISKDGQIFQRFMQILLRKELEEQAMSQRHASLDSEDGDWELL